MLRANLILPLVKGGGGIFRHCIRYRSVICIFGLAIAFSLSNVCVAAPYFRGTALLNTPTAYLLQQGFFDAGIHTVIHDEKRCELAIRMDFGIFNFTELGLISLKKGDRDYLIGNAKLLLIQESGTAPALSIGIDNFGEKIQDGSEDYKRSFYGVLSKQFNLPVVYIFSGHLGVGNHRYKSETSIGEYLHGVFIGLSKEFHISSLKSRLLLMCEVDGRNVNTGMRYIMDSGLSVNLAMGQLGTDPEDFRYYIGVSFTNESIMKKIHQTSELARRAAKIAGENRPDDDK